MDVAFTMTDKPFPHMDNITLIFHMPRNYTPSEREKLEKAAGRCPIKTSFRPEMSIIVKYNYVKDQSSQGWHGLER